MTDPAPAAPTMPVAQPLQSPSPIGHCRQCGYDLRGLSENRCPECGTAFDPTRHGAMLERQWCKTRLNLLNKSTFVMIMADIWIIGYLIADVTRSLRAPPPSWVLLLVFPFVCFAAASTLALIMLVAWLFEAPDGLSGRIDDRPTALKHPLAHGLFAFGMTGILLMSCASFYTWPHLAFLAIVAMSALELTKARRGLALGHARVVAPSVARRLKRSRIANLLTLAVTAMLVASVYVSLCL